MKNLFPYLLLLLANLFYGINFSVAKIVMPEFIKPYGFVVLRSLSAMIFFWLVSLGIKELRSQKIIRKDYYRIIACAFFGVCLNQLNFFKGLELTGPISASILMTTTPIIVMVLSFFILKNPITKFKFLGLVIGLVGAVIIILSQDKIVAKAPNPIAGNLLVFLNAASYAFYIILAKPLLEKYHPILVLRWMFTFGFLWVLPFGANQIVEIQWNTFTPEVIYAIIFVLLFVSCLTYMFNLSALKKVNPSTVSVFIYSQPVFAILIALVFGADKLDASKIIGALFVFLGVYLVINPQIKKQKI